MLEVVRVGETEDVMILSILYLRCLAERDVSALVREKLFQFSI